MHDQDETETRTETPMEVERTSRASDPPADEEVPKVVVAPPVRWSGAPGPRIAGVVRCPICLELVRAGLDPCPECGESTDAVVMPARLPPIAGDPPDASWLRLHWRPLVTMGAIGALIGSGMALRYLAPDRFAPSRRAASAPATAVPMCGAPCWSGEACQLGRCVWQRPNDVGHVSTEPSLVGPFSLPKDASDALPLDDERFAVALLTGMQVRSTRTGEALSLVSEAPQTRRLYRVGDVIYAAAPSRIYVIDVATTRLLKTIELGSMVGELVVGGSGRRVLVSLPAAHAVAILATEYHAEIERIQFGDDAVGPMGVDDSGTRAVTTTGQVPLAGLRDLVGGVAYPFDPSRLGSEQDRVRTSMVGNPASVLMMPDGSAGFVALRAENALVPLTLLPSGAVRQEGRVATCREPEQVALVRSGRRAIVRCNEGRALQMFDLQKRELVKAITFSGRAVDLAVSPDGLQSVVALNSGDGTGAVGLVDLEGYTAKVFPVGAEPTRVRLTPDGSTALALSERAKLAWMVR